VRSFDPDVILVTLAGSLCTEMAIAAGLRVAREAFPDRAYQGNGQLTPRNLPGAMIHDPEVIGARVVKLVNSSAVTSIDGQEVAIQADTLCLHGDAPDAWNLARAIREALTAAGVEVVPMAMICAG
jgi:UPF0271 protein